jgi:hypothetical protein
LFIILFLFSELQLFGAYRSDYVSLRAGEKDKNE